MGGGGGTVPEDGAVRRPQGDEAAAFEHLQQRGYGTGGASWAGPPVPEPEDEPRALFVGGRPVAGCYLRRYDTLWGEAVLPMVGVGGVVTLPEARGRGHTTDLLREVLRELHEAGVGLASITTPFSYAFYRRLGWEYAFWRWGFRVPARGLRGLAARGGEVRFARADGPAAPEPVATAYARVVRARYQGAALRSPALWYGHLSGPRTHAYAWHGPDGPGGYAVVAVEGERLRVRELLAADAAALRDLLGFLAAFETQAEAVAGELPPDVPLDLLVPEQGDLERVWRPAGMLRVVDVPAALGARRYPDLDAEVVLSVADDVAPWNRGPWRVVWSGGRAAVRSARPGEPGPALALDVRTLAQVFAGVLHPAQAVGLGRAEGDDAAVRALGVAFASGRPPLHLERF
jgi:predicted acetyltransferase